jgi:hypothetical protein
MGVARGSSPRCLAAFALALASLAPGRGAAAADALPAVARPRLPATTGGETGAGTVFFLELPSGDVAAVGAAHSFDLRELAAAPEVEFRLGRTGVPVARSQRFLAPPGRPFTDPRGSLREDVVVFALEAPPQGARSLAAAEPGEARSGERVRILGVPAMVPQDEDDLFGRLVRVDATRLEVDLDVKADLRGWGGAPVLAAKSGRVLGILEAALPSSGTLRLGVAPIQAALDAAAAPLEAGRGAPFAAFAPEPAPAPPPGAETAAEERGEEDLEREPEFASGGATDTADFERAESDLEHRVVEAASAAARAGAPRETEVQIELEHPDDGAVFDSAAGAFLAGRALAQRGDFKRFDVALVLDTSGSTAEATGVDVNGNGIVGASGIRGLFRNGDDPGDSILAAEVLAALRLLERFDPRNVRVSVISFSGSPPAGSGGGVVISLGPGPVPSAVTEVPLTGDFDEVGRALFRVLQRGPYGGTHIAAGLDQATIELLGLRGSISEPDPKTEKVVVFLTDGLPSLPTGVESYDVRACLRAAERARRAGVKVHTFAIGPEALSGPMATVEMARRTGGAFTPVRNPADIVSMIEGVSLVDLSEVRVRNLTTGKDAGELELRLDGGFAALLDLAPGRNRIEVYARASDGSEARREITLQYAPGAPLPEVPPSLVATKNLLLERRLTTLKQVGLGIERTQAERTRGELALAIQRERQQAEERAAAQRRELRIDVEAEPPSGGAPAPEATP